MLLFRKIRNWVYGVFFPTPKLPAGTVINQTLFCPICKARQARNVKICHKFAQYKLGAAAAYSDNTVRKLIWQLKYRGKARNAAPLAALLIRYIENCSAGWRMKIENFIVIPIPLSKKRLRLRGYNQAALVAKLVAERFNLPMETGALIRQKDAKPQMEIGDWAERKMNILNCFGVARPELIKERNILLIDDVFTSGATMTAAAHQLRDFGAKRILGLVIAKAS